MPHPDERATAASPLLLLGGFSLWLLAFNEMRKLPGQVLAERLRYLIDWRFL